MTIGKNLALAAEDFGLDPAEARLALLYAAASKELAQRTPTATPDEVTRLRGMKRVWSLSLDLHQRLNVAATLPSRLTDQRQCELVGQLLGTSQELCRLEKILHGKALTPKDKLIATANASYKFYQRAQKKLKSIASGEGVRPRGRPRRTDSQPRQ